MPPGVLHEDALPAVLSGIADDQVEIPVTIGVHKATSADEVPGSVVSTGRLWLSSKKKKFCPCPCAPAGIEHIATAVSTSTGLIAASPITQI
jgi:hypothetical protein